MIKNKNVLIEESTIIRPNVTIGDNSEVRQFCFIGESAKIGKNVKIFQYSNIAKGTIIEDCVYIGARVTLTNTKRISHMRKYPPIIQAPIIRYGARIASGVTILPGVEIGKNALVGAGSLVIKSVPENAKVIGSPAKIVGTVPLDERI